jgi:predicted DCC family thiol-disulfide oxidoreductase YuxK
MNDQGEDGKVIFYDGVCPLCNGLIRIVLRFDRKAEFRYSSLQSDYARETLSRHERNPLDLDTDWYSPRMRTARSGFTLNQRLCSLSSTA